MQEIQELADRALIEIPKRVAHYAQLLQVDYGRITIRNQKSRWGSCSGKRKQRNIVKRLDKQKVFW